MVATATVGMPSVPIRFPSDMSVDALGVANVAELETVGVDAAIEVGGENCNYGCDNL